MIDIVFDFYDFVNLFVCLFFLFVRFFDFFVVSFVNICFFSVCNFFFFFFFGFG